MGALGFEGDEEDVELTVAVDDGGLGAGVGAIGSRFDGGREDSPGSAARAKEPEVLEVAGVGVISAAVESEQRGMRETERWRGVILLALVLLLETGRVSALSGTSTVAASTVETTGRRGARDCKAWMVDVHVVFT